MFLRYFLVSNFISSLQKLKAAQKSFLFEVTDLGSKRFTWDATGPGPTRDPQANGAGLGTVEAQQTTSPTHRYFIFFE